MTLGIICISQRRIFHVCDRRVTTIDGLVFSETENKNLVVFPDNGVLSISYTGPAFLRSQGTDFWIADAVVERSFDPAWSHVPYNYAPLTAKQAIWRIASALKARLATNPSLRSHHLEIVAAGYVQDKKRAGLIRPICYRILKLPASKEVVVSGTSYTRSLKFISGEIDLIRAPRCWLNEVQLEALQNRLLSAKSAAEVEGVLVSTVRDVSTTETAVGGDIMSLQIPFPGSEPKIGVKFFPKAQNSISYTPWLVGTSFAHLPFRFQHRRGTLVDVGCVEFQSETPWPKSPTPIPTKGNFSLSPIFITSPMPKRN